LLGYLLGGLHGFHLGLLLLLVGCELRSGVSGLGSDLLKVFGLLGLVNFVLLSLGVVSILALHGGNYSHNLF
jgi:hypothetical protein